ncbi:MAG: DUF6174 domain-containing protein [Pyrinomonadaceae bacterium]
MGTQSTDSSSAIDSAEFDRWKAQRIVNYDMTISLETTSYLEPAGAVIVKVRNASPTSIEVADAHDRGGRLGFYEPYRNVELMYARIAELRQRRGAVSVKYNEQNGYPEEIEYLEGNPDASFTFRVLRFERVD